MSRCSAGRQPDEPQFAGACLRVATRRVLSNVDPSGGGIGVDMECCEYDADRIGTLLTTVPWKPLTIDGLPPTVITVPLGECLNCDHGKHDGERCDGRTDEDDECVCSWPDPYNFSTLKGVTA